MNHDHQPASLWAQARTVYRKELRDAMRDYRTLWVMLGTSVLLAPVMLWALSLWMSDQQAHADTRVVWVQGMEHAPTLRNFLERQTLRIQKPPDNVNTLLQNGQFRDPVLLIPEGFEAALAQGRKPTLNLLSDSSNTRAQAGLGRWERVLNAFIQERATLALALRGVSPDLLGVVQVQEHDLAQAASRAASIGTLLPWVFIMAVLSGALNGALDTTAGERERGSLEPLLMNPVSSYALAWGKWASVFTLSAAVAMLSCLSFIPAQAALQSEALRSLIQLGPQQLLYFVMLLLPLAASVSALLMWVAIGSRSVKEAQASATVVVTVFSALPMLSVLHIINSTTWTALVPGLGQHALMGRVLRGDPLTLGQWLGPWMTASAIVLLCVLGLARRWRKSLT